MRKFCRACGARLLTYKVGAENYQIDMGGGGFTPYSHSDYNPNTGKRQYVLKYVCPKKSYKKIIFFKIGNEHDDFMGEEIIK